MTDKLNIRMLKWLETQPAGKTISAASFPESVRGDATHGAITSRLLQISREAAYAGILTRTGVGEYRKEGAPPTQEPLPFAPRKDPGRRLTSDEEACGVEMFAAGASEKKVADALGCSLSTAHRLRVRTAAREAILAIRRVLDRYEKRKEHYRANPSATITEMVSIAPDALGEIAEIVATVKLED